MVEKHTDDLGNYDYARRIAAENRDKSLGERFRLIRASQEHKDRQLLARTRAVWMGSTGLSALLLSSLTAIAIGAPSDPQMLVVVALVALAGCIFGWRIGTRHALQKLAARRLAG